MKEIESRLLIRLAGMLGCYYQIGYHTLIGMQISGSSRGVDEVEHLIKLHYQLPI